MASRLLAQILCESGKATDCRREYPDVPVPYLHGRDSAGETFGQLRRDAATRGWEVVCCNIYDRDAGTNRAGERHAICFWGEAAARIAEGRADG